MQAQVAYEVRWNSGRLPPEMAKASPRRTRKSLVLANPAMPKRPLDTEGQPGVLFNSMIHPVRRLHDARRDLVPGRRQRQAGRGSLRPDPAADDPRLARSVGAMSFRSTSSSWPITASRPPPGTPDPWALLQDRMRRVLDTTPKTGMAIINDVGEAKDIHPKNKKDPGERLALWALAKDYGRDLVYSGPLYKSSEVASDDPRQF